MTLWHVFGFWGCDVIGNCQLNPHADAVVVRFVDLEERGLIFSFESIELQGFGPISATVSQEDQIRLPLNFMDNSAVFIFKSPVFDPGQTYGLEIKFRSEIILYHEKCDGSIKYYDLEAISNDFDSLNLVGNSLDVRVHPVNVEIYL